jgi:hypothetical protein
VIGLHTKKTKTKTIKKIVNSLFSIDKIWIKVAFY